MSAIEMRSFRRSDRDQLTRLVNAHAAAVLPGVSASVSAVLSSLERRPGEFIEDPWVSERVTLVVQQQDRITAAAHLLRYFADERAGAAARDVGAIEWFLFWPEAPAGNPFWLDAAPAAGELMAGCIRQLEEWGVARQEAGGELPVRSVYGVPGQWPHISAIYERAGFTHAGHTEIIYLARVADLPTRLRFRSRAFRWLRAAGVDRLLAYAWLEGTDPADWTTPTTGRSFRQPGLRNSPGPGEDGPGAARGTASSPPPRIALRKELAVHLVMLAVPGCPHVNLLEQRLAQVLQGRRDVTVSRHVVDDQDEATRCGMHGSPTLLVDGTDPFAEPGQQASVSCRLYRDSSGRAEGAPSVSQLRQAISEPDAITAGTRAGAGGPEHPDGQVLKSGARPSGGDHTEKGTSPDIRSRELPPQHKPETRRRVPGAQGCRGSGMPR